MTEDMKKSAINFFKKATVVASETASTLSETASTIKNEYSKSDLKKEVDLKLKDTKEILDEAGISKKAAELSSYSTEQLDKVSGKKILELVEEKLETQDRYNNILATKLEEALDRIAELEAKL